MEASRFGFGDDVPPEFKFDPTDADLVACYLLPRAVGLHNPYGHAIIDDDPMSLPPPELLRKHSHGSSDQAFFGPPRIAGRIARTVGGDGTWGGQSSTHGTVTLLRHGGGEVDIRYRRYDLTYKRTGEADPSGWVMHEYQITSPPLLSTVLTCVGLAAHKRNQRRREMAEAEHPKVLPAAEQPPGPDAQGSGALYNGEDGGGGMEETGGYDYSVPGYEAVAAERQQVLPTVEQPPGPNAQASDDNGENGGCGMEEDFLNYDAMEEMGGYYCSAPRSEEEDTSSSFKRLRLDDA